MEVQLKRPYEAVIIMHPDASLDEQKALFQKNKGIIEGFQGAVNHVETWGRRNLGNPIEKNRKGTFFFTTFESNPQAIAELERTMRINDKVLRFQHTRLDERIAISKHLEIYRGILEETLNREKEREAKKERTKLARSQNM
jgi:small subunit ribosomal protein S6